MIDKDLNKYFQDTPGIHLDKKKNRFTNTIRKVLTNWLIAIVVPWLAYCLRKYSEDEFHAKMADSNFDFLVDWKTNHAKRYNDMIRLARKYKNMFVLDEWEVMDRVLTILRTETSWDVRSS